MTSVFARSQRNSRITRPQNRDNIDNMLFSSISEAVVTRTGGQGYFYVRRIGNDFADQGEVYVQAISQHASYAPADSGGDNVDNFEDSQTASGMVVPQPQVGTRGIIATPNKDAMRGVWLGAIMPPGLGQTIPEPARSDRVTGDSVNDLAAPMGTPAAELNRTAYDGRTTPDRAQRAVHPFASVLQRQGLLVDTIRGSSTSSMLRDNDSRMIGFNTPGGFGTSTTLVETNGPGGERERNPQRLSRLGGHTFVMDDGSDDGSNNMVRIRSSKGAQILFHDTEELVYITNQNGTAWIEMTADGKIDVYAKDSVSIHSEADFNFRADRDINFEAGRNLNLKGVDRTQIEGDKLRIVARDNGIIDVRGNLDFTSTNLRLSTNDLSINSTNLNISNKINTEIRSGEIDLVTQYGMRTSHGTGLEVKTNVFENQAWFANTYNSGRTYYKGETVIFNQVFYRALQQTILPNTPATPAPPAPGPFWEIIPPVIPQTVHGDFKVDTNVAGPLPGQIQLFSKDAVKITATEGTIDLLAVAKNINLTTPQTVYIDGSSAVHLNLPGPGAVPATPIPISALSTSIPFPYDTSAEGSGNVAELGVFENSVTDSSLAWNEGYYQAEELLFSIMKRIPMHEPWTGHESGDGSQTSSSFTDRQTSGR